MQQNKNIAIVFLIFSNMIPLFGALFLGWQIASIILIYWLENVVVGFYNVKKMLRCEKATKIEDGVQVNGKPYSGPPGLFIVFFFIVHFGIFTLVHGVFVFQLFVSKGDVNVLAVLIGLVSIFISHGVSYKTNYIGRGEYKKYSQPQLMFVPYKRIVVLHFVIMFGGFAVHVLSLEVLPLVILVVLKTGIDLVTHKKERMVLK